MVICRSLSWARPQGEEIRPRYFPPKTKSGPPHDLYTCAAGRGAQALEASVSDLGRWTRISDGRRKADAAREDATDPILPCSFTSEITPRNFSHAPPQLRFGNDR